MEFDAEAPLDGEDTREDTPEDDREATQDEPALDEEAPSEVNTVAYQNILNQIEAEQAERQMLSTQIQNMAETIHQQREAPIDTTGMEKEMS